MDVMVAGDDDAGSMVSANGIMNGQNKPPNATNAAIRIRAEQ